MVPATPRQDLPDGVLERVLDCPSVRPDRIADVCRRIAAGECACADDVAAAVVRDARALLDVRA